MPHGLFLKVFLILRLLALVLLLSLLVALGISPLEGVGALQLLLPNFNLLYRGLFIVVEFVFPLHLFRECLVVDGRGYMM